MHCEEVRCKLGSFSDGELAPDRVYLIEVHLKSCEACSAELTRIRSLSNILSDFPRPEVPGDLEDSILRAASSSLPSAPRVSPLWAVALRTAAALLIALVGFYFGMRSSRRASPPPAAPAATASADASVEGLVQESFALLPADSPGAQFLALYDSQGEGR